MRGCGANLLAVPADGGGAPVVSGMTVPGSWSWHGVVAAAVLGVLCIVAFPLLGAYMLGESPGATAAVIGAALCIEYGACPVGLVLGLSPGFVFFSVGSVGAGLILLLYAVLDGSLLGSCRWQTCIARVSGRFSSSRLVRVYGILALLPGALTLGLYVCTPAAWLIGWDRRLVAGALMAGYLVGGAVFLLGGMGIIAWIRPP